MKKNNYKQDAVNSMFSSVANKYDVMNSIMSLGLQNSWKRKFVQHLPLPRQNGLILDVATGTGDVASLMRGYQVIACDINMDMIKTGLHKTANSGAVNNITWIQCSAERLPFANNSFDGCSIAFGLRNVEDRDAALREFLRILKPGGKFICMEFSYVENDLLRKIYELYRHEFIPMLGGLVADDRETYAYLAESIAQFPAADLFANELLKLGFSSVSFQQMTFGTVAIHSGYKA